MSQKEIYLDRLQGKRVAVIGIGVSNTPLIRKLCKAGIAVTACDRSGREKLGAVAEELEAQGRAQLAGGGLAEKLDEVDVPLGDVLVEVELAGTGQVLQQQLGHLLHPSAGGDLPVQEGGEVELQIGHLAPPLVLRNWVSSSAGGGASGSRSPSCLMTEV